MSLTRWAIQNAMARAKATSVQMRKVVIVARNYIASRPHRLYIHRNRSPFLLPESRDAENAADEVPQDDRGPDICWHQRPRCLDDRAQSKRNRNLRDDGHVERASCVAGALQATVVAERYRDEQTGDTQVPKQLSSDRQDERIRHAEGRKQVLGHQQKGRADDSSGGKADVRRHTYAFSRAVRIACTEVLTGNGCRCAK